MIPPQVYDYHFIHHALGAINFIVLHGLYNYDNAFLREEERQRRLTEERRRAAELEAKETMLCDE